MISPSDSDTTTRKYWTKDQALRHIGKYLLLITLLVLGGLIYSQCRARIAIDEPRNGARLDTPYVVLKGHTQPHAEVLRDIRGAFDPVIAVAEADGSWACLWELQEGKNTIRLHTGGREDHVTLTVYYEKPVSQSPPALTPYPVGLSVCLAFPPYL